MMEIHAMPGMPLSSMAMLAPLPAQLGGGAEARDAKWARMIELPLNIIDKIARGIYLMKVQDLHES